MARPSRSGTSGTYSILSVRLSHRESVQLDALRALAFGSEQRPADASGVVRALLERAYGELPAAVRAAIDAEP